jgi:hypothetical protein
VSRNWTKPQLALRFLCPSLDSGWAKFCTASEKSINFKTKSVLSLRKFTLRIFTHTNVYNQAHALRLVRHPHINLLIRNLTTKSMPWINLSQNKIRQKQVKVLLLSAVYRTHVLKSFLFLQNIQLRNMFSLGIRFVSGNKIVTFRPFVNVTSKFNIALIRHSNIWGT